MDQNKIGDPSATLNLIFAVLSFLTWGSCIGLIPAESSLALGIVQLTTVPIYLAASVLLTQRGEGFFGNIFLSFCCFFAVTGGTSSILTWASTAYGISYASTISGILWVAVSVWFIGVWRGFKYLPWHTCLLPIIAGTALLETGLMSLGILPAGFAPITGWQLFYAGCVGLWGAISSHLATIGVAVPQGPCLFKQGDELKAKSSSASNAAQATSPAN